MRSRGRHINDGPQRVGLWRRVLLVMVILGLVAAACGGGGTADASANDANARLVGSFETFGGEAIDLATVHDTDVVLWFWAPW